MKKMTDLGAFERFNRAELLVLEEALICYATRHINDPKMWPSSYYRAERLLEALQQVLRIYQS